MPPHTRRTAPDPTPPAPAANPARTRCQAALSSDDAAAAVHARTARGNSRTTGTPQEEPLPPARGTSAPEQARGFAPLTSLPPTRGSGSRGQAPVSAASSQNLPLPRTPVRSTPSNPLQSLPPQTPGRAAANRLLSELNQQSQMASPGPPVRNLSDIKSDSDEDLPAGRPRIPRPRLQPLTSLHSVLEDEPSPQSRQSRSRARDAAPAPRSGRGNQSGAQPASESDSADTWTGYQIDDAKYAWAEDNILKANTKSADCQAFFGEHIEHRGYKCRLCPQLYAAGSSLTTRRRHLGKEHSPAYLALIATRKLPNKLPDVLRKQRQEQRARDMQRIPFSIQAFENELVTVIVSNDLSINLIENPDFRDLLLLLRESLRDEDIPHRTKLRSLVLDAWLQYYDSLKKELKQHPKGNRSAPESWTFEQAHRQLVCGLSFDPETIKCAAYSLELLWVESSSVSPARIQVADFVGSGPQKMTIGHSLPIILCLELQVGRHYS
ncbi:hypothetical protein FB451DRAFT_1532285 [Mycena latifolia]|nr:hypothetical protein FB451DRAFT_1532285 [Mycena latifolia]